MRSGLLNGGARVRYLLVLASERGRFAKGRQIEGMFAQTIVRDGFANDPALVSRVRRLRDKVEGMSHANVSQPELLAWALRNLGAAISPLALVELKEAPGGGGGGKGKDQPDDPDDPPKKKEPEAEVVKVTPRLEVEYKVVLLDRKLSAHQAVGEPKVVTDPTAIWIWLVQDRAAPVFKQGATIAITGAGSVELFEDAAMTKKFDVTKPIPADRLAGGAKLQLFAAGRAAGKFTLKVTTEPPTDAKFVAGPPADAAMGVVELKCAVHRWNAADPPAAAAMADADKVKDGRYLHTQSKDKDHARAKLVVSAVVADQWPAGTDDYEVVLASDAASGAVEVWDAESDGARVAAPLKIKKSALAADKTYWIEGKTETARVRDVRLDLGIDRAAGGPARTAKRNGDWLRVTVVTITRVAPGDQFASPSADYSGDKHRVLINVKADGHKIKLKAQLSPKLKDIPLHFMLAPDKDNGLVGNTGVAVPAVLKSGGAAWKWTDIDASLKHKDRAKPADHWHFKAVTDANGVAECEVELSKIGGDVFRAGAYIEQDQHLAKFKHGDATHGKRKPTLSKKITVYRKLWYQIAKAKTCAAPQPAKSEAAYTRVKVDLHAGATKLFEKTDLPAALQNITFYPQWMVVAGGADKEVAVVGGHNWAHFRTNEATFFPKTDADELAALKARILVVDHQWDPEGFTALKVTNVTSKTSADITMSGIVVKPPLQGPLIQTATWEAVRKADNVVVKHGNLTDADILIEKPRTNRNAVKVKLPNDADPYLADLATYNVRVSLVLAKAKNYLGESKGRHILAVFDPSDVSDYNDTIAHEIGHSIGQTPLSAKQPKGLPTHPWWNTGMGTHCANPTTPSARSPVSYPSGAAAAQTAAVCLMFESGPVPKAKNTFCDTCHHYILARDMSTL